MKDLDTFNRTTLELKHSSRKGYFLAYNLLIAPHWN